MRTLQWAIEDIVAAHPDLYLEHHAVMAVALMSRLSPSPCEFLVECQGFSPPALEGDTSSPVTATALHAITATEATAYLTAHGFTRARGRNWYDDRSGCARVEVVDAEAACFTVYAFTRDRARLVLWQAQLTNAPLRVFAATVIAAIA